MFLILAILISNSFEAPCTEDPYGAGGTCKTCDPSNTNICKICNYEEKYEPNQDGDCSLKAQTKCEPVNEGGPGTCKECDAASELCVICNNNEEYEPNNLGNCTLKPKTQCKAEPYGQGGTCKVCDANNQLCLTCNYEDTYEPNQYGNCSVKPPPKCVEKQFGEGGTCSKCDTTTDLCIECNHPDRFAPNELGNCTEKPAKCNEKPGSQEKGSCAQCDKTADVCQVCNDPEHYQPNEYGNCTEKPTTKCVEIISGGYGTCAQCDKTADVCQVCNYPEHYQPNQYGNCTQLPPSCTEVQYGEGTSCSICNATTNLCATCNYAEKYEPDPFGTCTKKPFIKCVNVTDGAAGTCAQCDNNTNICLSCNYPKYYEPDQKGGCTLKPQTHCTEVWRGGPGTCSVCNPYTQLCEICNFQNKYAPNPFGYCSERNKHECSVANCYKCHPNNPNKCIECQYKYGLRGGYCTKCPPHLYEDSKHPCNPDCSMIPNCHVDREYDDDDCALENGQLYCLTCNDGFHPSDDFKSCIQNTPSPCLYNLPGCLECAYNGSRRCSKCDVDKNFILDREDGECKCRRGFEYILGQCLREKEVEKKCDESLHKCGKCAFNSTTCIECDDHYGLENGTCVKCPKGSYVSGELPCMPRCTSIPHCLFCSEDGSYCYECEDDYEDTDDHSKCIDEEKGPCAQNVTGCKKCSRSDPTFCLKCDKDNNFDESEVFPGTCVCDEDYDYYNGRCIVPFSPAVPPSGPSDQVQIDGVNFTRYVIVSGNIYTIMANATFLPGTLYILLIPITITTITIPKGPKFFQLSIPKVTSGVYVSADPTTQVDLSCPNGAQIIIPDNNNNYVLRGNGFITLNPGQGLTSVIIKKILMDQTGNSMQLNSNSSDITVKEIEVYGYQTIAGQSISHHTRCEIARIQSGSTFAPSNITLDILKIGIQSVIQIKGNSNVDISDYQVYYNSTITKIPIQFTSPFPNFRKSKLKVYNMNQDAILNEDETFNVASFTGENSKQACEDFKLDSNSDFKSSECQTFGDITYKVAKRAASSDGGKKKKGLSAGAIAGIVVGCVVAVGLVVFLCVWFLVIKKRQPAHKRSGEPANSREKLEV